jgi:hypothetical protein
MFYVVTPVCIEVNSPYEKTFLFLLVVVYPAFCFIVSLVYSIMNKFMPFQLLFSIFVGILFIPAMFIFYNSSAWIYMVIYTIISLAGNAFGYILSIFVNYIKMKIIR